MWAEDFKTLHRPDGEAILVNADAVLMVEPAPDSGLAQRGWARSRVVLVKGEPIPVRETVTEVLAILTAKDEDPEEATG